MGSNVKSTRFPQCRKAATHDDEIQHLYEEMEQQIKNEKDRIVLQVKECYCFRFIVSSMNCTSFFFLLPLHLNQHQRLFSRCSKGP